MTRTQRTITAQCIKSFCRLTCCGALLLGAGSMSRADETTPDWTTTELGVTVTHDEILDTIDRCADFWPAVCRHVEKQGDEIASDAARTAVIGIIRKTQFELHKQFFEADDRAKDMIVYTSWGLRRAMLYRRAGDLVKDRQTLIRLRDAWQACLDGPSRGATEDLADTMARRTSECLASSDLDAGTAEQLISISRDIAACMNAMEATGTAAILRRAEHRMAGVDA